MIKGLFLFIYIGNLLCENEILKFEKFLLIVFFVILEIDIFVYLV